MKDPKRLLPLFILLALALGCARVISKETLRTADRNIKFEDVVKDPERYAGSTVLLGGAILKTENLEKKTMVEVIQEPLNYELRPRRQEQSAGRFLVEFDGFMDPEIYAPGRLITVVGKIKGPEKKKLGETVYSYPVIVPDEHFLWNEGSRPSVGVGIGLGLGYTHID